MLTDDVYIINKNGEDQYIMKIKNRVNAHVIIEKFYNENKTKSIYSIKYYYNNIFQNISYGDSLEIAKDKSKSILCKIENKIKSFKNFNQKK